VLVAGTALLLLFLRARPSSEPLVVQLVGDHVVTALGHGKPIEIASSNPAEVERWLAGKVDFAVTLPQVRGAKLAGGRLCSVAGRHAFLAFYDAGPRRMSLFAMAAEPTALAPPCVEGIRGFTVCRHRAKGVDYALVSDLPASEALPLLEAGL
jgi:anti-sigma factor RsiW